jgi:hypothetical protein
MPSWLTDHVWWLTVGAVVTMLAGAAGAAWFAVQMPADFLQRPPGDPGRAGGSSALRLLWKIARNALALVLVLLGLVLSLPLVPGPGILLVLLGLSLADFPGKQALERRLASHPLVRRQINRLRALAGKPPLDE